MAGRTRSRRPLTAALVAVVMAVTGCAERGSTAPANVLNVGQISNSVAFFPLFVAERKGYFEEEGVTLGERPRLGTEALVTYLFARVGLRTDTDAELVNLGGVTSAALGALKSGRVDALAFFQPIAQQAQAAGIGRNYISPARGDVPRLSNVAHGVVFTTQAALEEKTEEVAAFQRAVGRAQRLIHEQPAQVEPLLAGYLKGIDPDALAALSAIIKEEIPKEIGFARASYDTAVEFHRETGLIDRFPSYEENVPESLRIAGS
ncbi:ABC transporter substrate-binding protein [Nonomuraea sp. KM88]|uniref:ABC transporter substrate-binding protein n=1 Tax=Nonomuraea sp. KM88 TaxID=3457427 RepID=UPI003FCD238D